MAVLGVEAGHEVIQVLAGQRVLLEGEVLAGNDATLFPIYFISNVFQTKFLHVYNKVLLTKEIHLVKGGGMTMYDCLKK